MLLKTLAVTAIAAAALSAPAHAAPEGRGVDCARYSGLSPEQQARLDARMAALDARLAGLDARIQARVAAANGRVAAAQAEAASRRAEVLAAQISPERIRAITDRAVAQARIGEQAAAAAQAAIARIQPRLDQIAHQMDNLDIDIEVDN